MSKKSAQLLKEKRFSDLRLSSLRRGPVLTVRVFLLCLFTLLGSLGVTSHVHEPFEPQASHSIDTAGSDSHALHEVDLEAMVAGDCDQFHINTVLVADSCFTHDRYALVSEKGQVSTHSADSISPELFPPARAPPSEMSII